MDYPDTDKPICLDLFCGRGGWTRGFMDAGYYVIGVDQFPHEEYPGDYFVSGDLRLPFGGWLAGQVDVIVASPPCDEFSPWLLPWMKDRRVLPDMTLVNNTYRIRELIKPRIFVLENVRAARYFLGPSISNSGPYYFWGDAALMPKLDMRPRKKQLSSGGQVEVNAG